jgi:hypothetical protein
MADEVFWAASRAFFLTTRGSPFSIMRSLIVRLRLLGIVDDSEKDMMMDGLKSYWMTGWILILIGCELVLYSTVLAAEANIRDIKKI